MDALPSRRRGVRSATRDRAARRARLGWRTPRAADSVWLILAVGGGPRARDRAPVLLPLGPVGRRGAVGQHRRPRRLGTCGRAAPRRRAAALLPAPPRLDAGRSAPGTRRSARSPGLSASRRSIPMWYIGRRLDQRRARPGCRRPDARTDRLGRGAAARRVAVRDPVLDRGAHVRARHAARCSSATSRSCASLDRPSWGRLLCVAADPALLLYTHYWAFALLAVVRYAGSWLVAVRGAPEQRRAGAARRSARSPSARSRSSRGCRRSCYQAGAHRHAVGCAGEPGRQPRRRRSSRSAATRTRSAGRCCCWCCSACSPVRSTAATSSSTSGPDPGVRTRGRARVRHARARAAGRSGDRHHVRGPLRVGDVPAVPARRRVRGHRLREPDAAVRGARAAARRRVLGRDEQRVRSRTQAFQVVERDHGTTPRPATSSCYCPDSIGTDVSRLLPDDVRQVELPELHRRPAASTGSTTPTTSTRCTRSIRAARSCSGRGATTRSGSCTRPGAAPRTTKCGLIADGLAVLRPRAARRRARPVLLRAPGPVPVRTRTAADPPAGSERTVARATRTPGSSGDR